jgi:hypothetical protein
MERGDVTTTNETLKHPMYFTIVSPVQLLTIPKTSLIFFNSSLRFSFYIFLLHGHNICTKSQGKNTGQQSWSRDSMKDTLKWLLQEDVSLMVFRGISRGKNFPKTQWK